MTPQQQVAHEMRCTAVSMIEWPCTSAAVMLRRSWRLILPAVVVMCVVAVLWPPPTSTLQPTSSALPTPTPTLTPQPLKLDLGISFGASWSLDDHDLAAALDDVTALA